MLRSPDERRLETTFFYRAMLLCQWKVMLANLLADADVNGRAFPLVIDVDVSQLPITLRAERRSDGFYAVGDHVFMAWVLNIR